MYRAAWILLAGVLLPAPARAEEDAVLAAVDRALPYLEKQGEWWIEEKKCASCHHSTFFVWAKDLAREAGMELDLETLDEQREWLWTSLLKPKKPAEGKEPDPDKLVADGNVEGVSQLLVSASAEKIPAEIAGRLRERILHNRRDDGNWKPNGQLPRQERAEEETQWTSNQWARFALGDAAPAGDPLTGPAEGRSPESAEWYVLDVLLSGGKDSINVLVDRQNDDGGWSWLDGEGSSPLATGQALFALGRTGAAAKHITVVGKARDYLVGTQAEGGHWVTMSTKDREESTRVSNFWGSAWAVIGLLEARGED